MAEDSGPRFMPVVLLPALGGIGLIGYAGLYLAALTFFAPFGTVPEDAGLAQPVLLVRLVALLSALAVLTLLLLAVSAVVLATADAVRRLAGRPRLDLSRRRPNRRVVVVAVTVLVGILGSGPGWSTSTVVEAVLIAVLVVAATWLAHRVSGGAAAPVVVLALAAWASVSFWLVGLGYEQSDKIRATGTWDDSVSLLGVYPGYAYIGAEYAQGAASGEHLGAGINPTEPYVTLGDSGGVFVLFSCRDARTVRVSTAAVSVSLVPEDTEKLTAARNRCTELLTGG